MHTTSLQQHHRTKVHLEAPSSAPSCNVDYRKHQRDQRQSLSYMEKLLGEG